MPKITTEQLIDEIKSILYEENGAPVVGNSVRSALRTLRDKLGEDSENNQAREDTINILEYVYGYSEEMPDA